MATYLVTGGAGFIGSHLADALLAAGHSVRVLDDLSTGVSSNLDPRCTLIQGDVADEAAVVRAMDGVDGCFHLAAIASVQRGNEAWSATHRVNQSGTVAVLDCARAGGRIPVVYASSAAIYGTVTGIADETMRPSPRTAYGADKLGSELHAQVGWLVHGVPSAGFRFFNVYGPRQDPASPYSGVISIFARRTIDGLGVTVDGDGRQTRDFVFVADVVLHLLAGMALLHREPGAHVLNVCTGRETSLLQLIDTLAQVTGRTPATTHGPARAGDIARSVGAPGRATALLGVAATTPLLDGLRSLVASTGSVLEPAGGVTSLVGV